jgi:penicillin amidase
MELLAPILKTKTGCAGCKALLEWDGRFATDSVGASIFTQLREALLDRLFGEQVFGKDVWNYMTRESGVMLVFQWYFDRVLLWDIFERENIKNAFFDFAEDNAAIRWLWNELLADHEDATTGKPGREGKDAVAQARRAQFLERIVDDYLVTLNVSQAQAYGVGHFMTMRNIFFNGELPSVLGFDVGPIPLAGSGSTVNQVRRLFLSLQPASCSKPLSA